MSYDVISSNQMEWLEAHTVGLVGDCSSRGLALLRQFVHSDLTVVLLDPAAPPSEHTRVLSAAGAEALVQLDPFSTGVNITELRNATVYNATTSEVPTIVLTSSGSTGLPQLVRRTRASLWAEGRRLALWSDLGPDDLVVLPLPYWHAYALGWVHAAWHVGCPVDLVDPQALGAVEQAIDHATVVPLVPTLARLLATRRTPRARPARLRLAMVGAGAVDARLERQFRARFGIGLARNYGSTETGALFSGVPGLPDGCVGHPMTDVAARVDGKSLDRARSGELFVSLSEDKWHATGDMVGWSPEYGLRIIGRRTRSIRRGDRWVSPEEVESALLADPSVLEARVLGASGRGRANAGNQRLIAEIVVVKGTGASMRPIRERLKNQLAPYKLPDELVAVPMIARTGVGKVRAAPRLTVGEPARLIEAAQAYRVSEVLFALMDTGIIDQLSENALTPSELCDRLSIDRAMVYGVVEFALHYGLVRAVDEEKDTPSFTSDLLHICSLEQLLSRSWNTREALGAALTSGFLARAFDTEGPSTQLRSAYRTVMHGPASLKRARLGVSLVQLSPADAVLEVTSGGGHYATEIEGLMVVDVGAMAKAPTNSLTDRLAPESFDVIVVSNAIHLRCESSNLEALANLLRPGGRLLVDDVFLNQDCKFILDWLTHGGDSWPTVDSLASSLPAAGLTVRRRIDLGGSPHTALLLASKDAM